MGWGFARVTGAEVQLLHIVPDLIAGMAAIGAPPTLKHLILRDARARVERSLRGVLPDAAVDRLAVEVGRPAAILAHIGGVDDLLVLGGKHHSAIARWLAGSTAHQVARDTNAALLIAGPRMELPRRVLAAVDLSAGASLVIAAARRVAAACGARLGVLHVLEPSGDVRPTPLRASIPLDVMSDGEWARMSRTTFDNVIWPLVQYPGAERLECQGPVTDAIRSEATYWGADLLVVGSHGKGRVEHLLVGSTTRDLLGYLPASMLIVPVVKRAAIPSPLRVATAPG